MRPKSAWPPALFHLGLEKLAHPVNPTDTTVPTRFPTTEGGGRMPDRRNGVVDGNRTRLELGPYRAR